MTTRRALAAPPVDEMVPRIPRPAREDPAAREDPVPPAG
jgi:hypothetical protein